MSSSFRYFNLILPQNMSSYKTREIDSGFEAQCLKKCVLETIGADCSGAPGLEPVAKFWLVAEPPSH